MRAMTGDAMRAMRPPQAVFLRHSTGWELWSRGTGNEFEEYTDINNKNCSLSIVLKATDQKPQKIIKKVILPTIKSPECQRDAE